jgi:hypothetical protein
VTSEAVKDGDVGSGKRIKKRKWNADIASSARRRTSITSTARFA